MPDTAAHDETRGIDLWRVRVGVQARAFEHHWQHLDAGERQHARTCRQEADRQRFVIARSTLRLLLGRQLQIDPGRVAFDRNEYGKPFTAAHRQLHFNTSHSGDWVLHGFASAVALGVDVEAVPPHPPDLEDFAQVLAPLELERLRSLPMTGRSTAFADLWVCKEAYVKALGLGLNAALSDICIRPLEDGGYELLDDRCPGGAGAAWTLAMIDLGPAHAGCVAYPGLPRALRIRDFDDDPEL